MYTSLSRTQKVPPSAHLLSEPRWAAQRARRTSAQQWVAPGGPEGSIIRSKDLVFPSYLHVVATGLVGLDSHQHLLHQLVSSEALGLDIKSPGDFQLLVSSCHTR